MDFTPLMTKARTLDEIVEKLVVRFRVYGSANTRISDDQMKEIKRRAEAKMAKINKLHPPRSSLARATGESFPPSVRNETSVVQDVKPVQDDDLKINLVVKDSIIIVAMKRKTGSLVFTLPNPRI